MSNDLRRIPFFSHLPDSVLDAIARRLRREHYDKGAVLFCEGDPGDCMYLIESGQVRVFAEKAGVETTLAYLGPGNFFGEAALLLDDKRTASVEVVIDVQLWVLHKDDFENLLQQHPAMALTLTRELSRRLGHHAPPHQQESVLITVEGTAAPALARQLAQVTGEDVFLLDLGGVARAPADQALLAQARVFLALGGSALNPEMLADRVSSLIQQYYWVLLALPRQLTPLASKAIELSHLTVTFGKPAPSWIADCNPRQHVQTDGDETSLRRLIRRIARRQVGLALSSGNARGIAHIGVLRVLEAEGIPVDMIAGTSAGAVFGSLYACGHSLDEVQDFAVQIQRQYNLTTGFQYWDFRLLPRTGLIKGERILDYLRQWLQDKRFDELRIPMYIVAADLISGEEIIFESGPVAEAVRASMSVIGIIEPAHIDGRYLIDGGAVNPVPTQILADKGMSVIMASNVIPSLEDRLHRREYKREGRPPNILGIVSGTMEIMESEIIRSRMGPVDVLIQPDVARYGTMDYQLVREIIQRGEEAARDKLPYIRHLVEPRPRPPLRT